MQFENLKADTEITPTEKLTNETLVSPTLRPVTNVTVIEAPDGSDCQASTVAKYYRQEPW